LKSSCWSPKRQNFLIIARLRRSLASTPNIRSVRCMVLFHDKITRSLETPASYRQRGGRFGRGSVPVARGRRQNGAANDPRRSATTARAVRVRELPRASPTMLKRFRRPRVRKASPIELLELKTTGVSNHRSPQTFAGFYAKHTLRAMHADLPSTNDQVARDAGKLPTAGWHFWPRERTRCKGQAPERCCERPLAVDHHRACRSCPRAAESKPKQC
jgi:hypothetical protein